MYNVLVPLVACTMQLPAKAQTTESAESLIQNHICQSSDTSCYNLATVSRKTRLTKKIVRKNAGFWRPMSLVVV